MVRHNPPPYFRDIGPEGDDTCGRYDVPFSRLDGDIAANRLPRFALIVPNVFHDMHSDANSRGCRLPSPSQSEVCQGDRWLRRVLPKILSDGGRFDVTVVILFDEGRTGVGGGGHVMVLEKGPTVCAGCRSSGSVNHYGMLHAIEDWFGLDHLEPHTPDL